MPGCDFRLENGSKRLPMTQFLFGGSTPRPRCCDLLEKVDVVGANGREAGRSLVMCGVGYLSSGNLSRKIGVSGRKIAAER